MNQIGAGFLGTLGVLVALIAGCSSVGELKSVCVPDVDCAAINSIETPGGCTTCLDCADNWGTCSNVGAVCKRGMLDLDPSVSGCEASVGEAHGQWVMHSTGDAVSSFLFNGGKFDLQLSVLGLAYDEDDPSCIPTADRACSYTVRALQLEIPDFEIPESSWSGGVATLSAPSPAADDGSGASARTPMMFAFDVRQGSTRRIALSQALVSVVVVREADPLRASFVIQADSIDFGGYEITDLYFEGELISD